ncbi:phosphotransferase [Blautia schinkii]|nr:phosphotransferase [Blautia schinkii]
MDYDYTDSRLTIKLCGRIDSANAVSAEDEIFGLIGTCNPAGIVLDAKELEYISSAGLRVVLKIKKKITETEIINASSEVYEVFQMTGFCDIIDIKKAMREISVEGCEKIGAGAHGTVYRLDGDTIVKVYNDKEPLSSIEHEIEYARSAFVLGVPTAIPFDVVRCGDSYGAVFELIEATTLSDAMNRHPENYADYSRKYTELIQTLHSTEGDTSRLSDIREHYHQWAEDMRKFLTEKEITVLHDIVASVPDRKTLVHGDIHPNNLMLQGNELVIIDMAAITYGHPVFDYAGMALSHVMSGAGGADMTKRIIGIDYPVALKLWDDLIKADYGGRGEDELARIKEVLTGFGWVKYSVAPAVNKNQNPRITEMVIRNAKTHFLPGAGKLIGAVDF